ncbi:RND efflux system inner membrane transporter CmeB [Vibrio variabilis]|uniref:RND efflux system inner membrane transporter CmeB n=1 Tax=Vibrio variabilis TaxID=990271 RepID=A0ABQ0J7F3_9VIBR|nr:RND efflux system inner membrane transporter CmeB [Vibrio variabilis]
MTICIALILSAVNALTLSPALCSLIMKRVEKQPKWFVAFNSGFEKGHCSLWQSSHGCSS